MMNRKGRLVCILALGLLLAGSWAMATGEGETGDCDQYGLCIEVTHECVDSDLVGPFEVHGTVTNCGDTAFDAVSVWDALNDEPRINILESGLLEPGASVEYWSEFDGDSCGASQDVWAQGTMFDTGCRVKVPASTTCDCLTDTCRTPGFWGTHAGTEKDGSSNITQAVIDAAPGGISVCGETVDNTSLAVPGSALEANCVHPRGDQIHQLSRQLAAAALNCVVSGSPVDCDGTSIETLFNSCNDICLAGTDSGEMNNCIEEIDCWNNGGTMLENGMCQLGNCTETGEPCGEDADCGYNLDGLELTCIPFTDTCHSRALVNEDLGLFFDPPGSAGSSKACNDAIKNDCYLLDCD